LAHELNKPIKLQIGPDGEPRLLSEEPLNEEDYRKVWLAYQGFLHQVHLIVRAARERG
jgi:hypothetical protein